MKRKFFKAAAVDESFFDEAPVKLVGTFEIQRPAGEVWDELTTDKPLSWCRIIGDGITWTSERPFGVGTTRTAKALKGLSELREYYFRWEEGRRHSFYAVEAAAPFFKRFAEDYLVEPTGDDSCRLTWTIVYEPTMLGKGPLNKWILGTAFADTRKHFAA